MACFEDCWLCRGTQPGLFSAMELHKMLPNLFHNVMNKVGLFVHKNAYQIRKVGVIVCGKVSTCFQCLAYLLRLHIAMARFIENEAEHVGTRIYGNTYVFRRA